MKTPRSATDLLKEVLAGTIRALADEPDLEVSFVADSSVDPSAGSPASMSAGASRREIHLPVLPAARIEARDLGWLRGEADRLACLRRFHDETLHRRHAPRDPVAAAAFEMLERARVEAIGGRSFPGVKDNLAAAGERRRKALGLERARGREEIPLAEALGAFVEMKILGEPPAPLAARALSAWRDVFEERAGEDIENLVLLADDQEAFAEAARRVLVDLDLLDEREEGEEQEDARGDDAQEDGDREKGDEESPSEESSSESEQGEGGGETAEAGEEESPPDVSEEGMAVEIEEQTGEIADTDAQATDSLSSRRSNRSSPTMPESAFYKVFARTFDAVMRAEELASPEELMRLRAQLDVQMTHLVRAVGRLANRLQRRLMAQQNRSWEFDLEEGILDTGRLARIVVDPGHALSFKAETDIEFKDTVVTLLIDNSGSMRGRPISIAAVSADILARTLERCGVKVEILGFTTRAWKGGRSREEWLARGKPMHPGRLNDLLHIVYKTADVPWRRARRNLGLMMKEGLLKENIDGEALLWAHQRLIARPEERRILMVISDGAPVDDSTLSVNDAHYLEQHLRQVIGWIEARSPVELIAIGIGHDVTRYYRRAVTIHDAEQLVGAMTEQLASLFEEEEPFREPAMPLRMI